MKFIYPEYGIELELVENQVNVLVAESPHFFSHLVQIFYEEKQSGTGRLVLSEKDKILPLSKTMEIIVNPFCIDPNERRIMQKLYQELCAETQEAFFYKDMENFNSCIVSYLEELSVSVPYHVTFDIEENVPNLFKAYNVRLETDGVSLLERLAEYLKLLHQLCKIQVIIFVNLKTYFSQDELEELYKFAFYEKLFLVLIENREKPKLKEEKVCIIDADGCIINLE